MKLSRFAAPMAALAAATMLGSMPAAAQPGYGQAPSSYGQTGWDRRAFWHGAPDDPYQRIEFLERRIQRGIADGSLNRREARWSERDLNSIREAARQRRYYHHGRLTPDDNAYLQSRLDNVSERLRWRRRSWENGYSAQADWDRRYATDYDAAHYYRDGNYSERRLSSADEVYRGSDGRYYCKRNDGTTGLIVGAAGGGLLGNIIDGGHNRVAGTLIGGALGALAGKSIDQNSDIRCR